MNNTEYIKAFTKESKKLGDSFRNLLHLYAIGSQRKATGSQKAKARIVKDTLLQKAKVLKKELQKITEQWVNDSIPKAAQRGYKQAMIEIEQIEAYAIKKSVKSPVKTSFTAKFGGIQKETTALLIQDSLIKSNSYLKTIADSVNMSLRKASLIASKDALLSEQLAVGRIQGETVRQLQRRIYNNLDITRDNRVLLINGNSWDAQSYANTFARTRTAEVADKALEESAKSAGFTLFQISRHSLKYPHDIYCTTLQGRIFATNKNEYGFKKITDVIMFTKKGRRVRGKWPPFHPNCRHSRSIVNTLAYTDSELKSLARNSRSV